MATEIQAQNTPVKLHHIDQLRGLAILLVILVHVYQSQIGIRGMFGLVLNFGIVGVQLFFLLSAYTLCLSMSFRKDNSTTSDFYIRRYFRIAPLYYAGILIYYMMSNIPALNLNGPLSNHENYTLINILSNLFFIHGMVPEANNTIVPGGWSIGTEMIFYLIFPALFLLYEKVKTIKFLLMIPLVALVLANVFILGVYYIKGDEAFTDLFYYFNIFNQLPVFAVGMTYFFLEKAGLIRLSKIKSAIFFLIFFLLSFVVMFKLKTNVSLGIFLVSIAFCFLFKLFKELKLDLPLLTRIGQLSFSIYIFHFLFAYPAVSVFVALLTPGVNALLLYIFSIIITVTLAMAVALLSEKFIEQPGIKLGKLMISRLSSKTVALKSNL